MGGSASDSPAPERARNGSGDAADSVIGRTLGSDERPRSGEGPDVYLDVPLLKVDEISLEVENLEAHVSLVAQVLDLLKLNVGADVFLGKVNLEIKGVEAQAQLKVRLDNVALIVDRVLTTLDRNPEILQHVGRGVEAATRDLGAGTGTAVGEVGRGARGAVADVGRGAGGAVENVGEGAGGAVQDVGTGTGRAVDNVGQGAGGAVQDVGEGARGAVGNVGEGTGRAAENVGEGTGHAVQDVEEGTRGAIHDVGTGTGRAAENAGTGAGEGVRDAGEDAGGAGEGAGEGADRTAEATGQGVADETGKAAESATGTTERKGTTSDGPTGDESDQEGTGSKAGEQPDSGEHAEASDGEQEITAVRAALHETEESVRDLGRALLRMISQQPRSSGRGDE